MSNRTEVAELEELYVAISEYDFTDHNSDVSVVRALVAYFRFIENTPRLQSMAQRILTDHPLIVLRPVVGFYDTLREAWKTEYSPINSSLQRDISHVRKAMGSFHRFIVAEAERKVRVSDQRLVEKDTNGDFFYDRQRVRLSKIAIYYQVLDALYSKADQNGFMSYKDIESYLVGHGRPVAKDKEKRNRRVNNAVSKSQGLFRYGLKNETPDGRKLIEIVWGKGLQFNNELLRA